MAIGTESERSEKKLDVIDAHIPVVLLAFTVAIIGLMSAMLCLRRVGHKISVKLREPLALRCPTQKEAPQWPSHRTVLKCDSLPSWQRPFGLGATVQQSAIT